MKLVKMFDYEEIRSILEKAGLEWDDVVENFQIWGNDSAYKWWVTDENTSKFEEVLNKYFLSIGCTEGEEVFIWISW